MKLRIVIAFNYIWVLNTNQMQNTKNDSWLKAAVIGSIWASFEIIFGTFLHNLRIPFAGTFLTFFSLVLLIGFSYKWNDRYLFLKAGIICALMRSMMPTSIILGPLIGILVEAVIFQFSLKLFGRTYLAFAVAGVLSMFSAIIHKIVSVLIIYGFDIVKLLENMYFILLKSTHIDLPVKQLFIIVSGIYVLLGIATAYMGVKVGREIVGTKKSLTSTNIDFKAENEYELFNTNNFKFNSLLIIIYFILLVASLVVLDMFYFAYALVFILPLMLFLVYRYGKSLRRLSKPIFWIQLLIIILISVLFWNNKYDGFIVGMNMITRAIVMVSLFTAISVELKNPVVKALMYKKGFSGLYSTIGLASSAVPFLIENIVVSRNAFTNPVKVLKKAIDLSDSLLCSFTGHFNNTNKITIISGETRSGKTTYLKNLLQKLKRDNTSLKIGGIIAHGIDKDGKRLGFEIEDVGTGKKMLLSNNIKEDGNLRVGRFYFKQSGLKFGRDVLLKAIEESDLLIIDEIGPFELRGKGWFDIIELAMQKDNMDMIWVVRKSLLTDVLMLWSHTNVEVIEIKQA